MEVILTTDYPALGYVGDKVAVRPGFARNYLLPRGIAVEALSRNAKLLKHRMTAIQAKRLKLKMHAEEVAKRFEGILLEFTLKMSDQGRSFGSVTVKDIEEALKAKGLEVDRKQIRLQDAVKRAGTYEATVKLHSEVSIPVTIRVLADKSAKPEGAATRGKRGAKRSEDAGAEGSQGEGGASDVGEADNASTQELDAASPDQ